MFNDKKGEKIKVRVLNVASTNEITNKLKKKSPIEKEAMEEFTNELLENKMVNNFTQKKPKKFKKTLFFIIFFLVLIFAAALAGFIIFGGKTAIGTSVDLKIQVPLEISSGDEIKYQLEIINKEKVAIKQIDLLLKYPYGFEYLSSSITPVNETKNSFPLPDIAAGANYKLTVTGRLVGEIDEQKNIEAILNYVPENFNSNFQVKKTAVSLIKDSVLGLTLEYPKVIIQNQSFEIKIVYQNNSQETQKNVKVVFEPAEGLIIDSASNSTSTEDWFWLTESLASGQQQEIVLKSHFEKTETSPKVEVKIGLVENEIFKIITYKRGTLQVIAPQIELKLSVNDQENLDAINWGEELNYKIKIKNNSQDLKIPSAVLKLKLNGDLIDKNFLKEDAGAVWKEFDLIWDEQSKIWDDFLKEISPGAEKEINLTIKVINQPADLENYSPAMLRIAAEAQLSSLELGSNFLIKSNEIVSNIGNIIQFSAKAFYYLNEGIMVGSGPIPPRAGGETTYKIYWYLNGGNNNLKNITIKAIVPPDVNWNNNFQVTNGQLSYDEASRQISWQVEELQIGDMAQANFYLSIIPLNSQIGQVITLLNPSTLTYKIDNQSFTQTVNLLDTNLEFDAMKKGQGVVEP